MLSTDFKRLMYARFFFTFAVQMQAVILGWQIYELLNDPLALGLIGLAEAVPAISLALYAGYLVDKTNPLYAFQRVILVSTISGAIVVLSELWHLNNSGLMLQVMALYLASFLTGVARSFSQASLFAIVPRLVPRENLHQSSAWMAYSMQFARIIGPATGGLIYGFYGMLAASIAVCVCLLGAVVYSQTIHLPYQEPSEKRSRPTREDLLSGVKFVFAHPILLPAMSLDMIAVLFGGVTALLPIFAKEILFIGPKGLGILRAAPAIGAAIMSLSLTRLNWRPQAGRWLLIAVSGFGLSIMVFALSQNFYLSLIALALSGAFDSVSMVVRTVIVQLESPDHLRGRIGAVNSMFIGSSNEIGELESGLLAKWLGAVNTSLVGAWICLLTVGVTAWYAPKLRRLSLS